MKSFRVILPMILVLLLLFALPAQAEESYSISGFAFLDENGNGLPDEAESLLAGVPLVLEEKTGDGWTAAGETAADENGQFAFEGLPSGVYRVILPASGSGYAGTALGPGSFREDGMLRSADLILAGGESISGLYAAVVPTGTLKFFAFQDDNLNGTQGKYEKPFRGMTVEVLRDGAAIASGVTGKDGYATVEVPAGEFTLRVIVPEGFGLASIGKDLSFAAEVPSGESQETYTLNAGESLSVNASGKAVGGIKGMAFEDINNNGIWDEGDQPVAGVIVHAEGAKYGHIAEGVSGENGEYSITLAAADKYTLTAELPEGMLFARYSKTGGDLRSIFTGSTLSREFSVKSGVWLTSLNIGTIQRGAITGTAFLDLNYNGFRDEDEPGYAGVTLEAIKISSGDSYGKTVTGADGAFVLENLRGGDYRLRAVLPDDGSVFSAVGSGTPAEANRFAQRAARRENFVEPLTITSGGQAEALVGVALGASVSGKVFQDADYSGTLNKNESPLAGIRVCAVDGNGTAVAEDTTGKMGSFRLEGIMPGTYTIQFQRKAAYGFTRARAAEENGSKVLTIEDSWGVCEPLTLAMGESVTGYNAGMLPSASVAGFLYHDENDNGVFDRRAETGVPEARVRLWSEEAEMDFTMDIAEDGSFRFDGVMPGTYDLEYLLPEHCEMVGGKSPLTEKAVTVAMGEARDLPEAGAVVLGSWEGHAFLPYDEYVYTGNEEGLAGVTVTLTPSGNPKAQEASCVTDADGAFSLTGLRPAGYTLSVTLPDGYIFAADPDEDGLSWPTSASAAQPVGWDLLISRSEKSVPALVPATLRGQVWMDENKDGMQAPNEWIMDGLTVELLDELQNDTVIARTVTDGSGYTFTGVRPGCYSLRFELPEQSFPADDSETLFSAVEESGKACLRLFGLQVEEGEEIDGLNAGLVSTTSIGGTVLLDENGERQPLAGAAVALLEGGAEKASAVTGADGAYRFDGLWPDEYAIRVTLLSGAIFLHEGDPDYAGENNRVTAGPVDTAESEPFRLMMAKHQLDVDVIAIKPGKVGDIAWLDENGNGLVDGAERRIPGVKVSLMQNGEAVYTTETDAFGYYLFDDVYPGEYVLRAEAYPELTLTTPVEALRIITSCLTSGDGTMAESDPFRVVSGSRNMNMDLGYLAAGRLPSAIMQEPPAKDWTIINTSPKSLN